MAQKQRDDTAYRQLKKDLAAGMPGRLYILYGEEAYLRGHYLGQMKKLLLSAGMEAFNFHTFSDRAATPDMIRQAVDCLPMMGGRTLVLVSDYDLFKASEDERTALIALFSDLPAYCCLVFVYDTLEYKPDARTKLAAAIKANGSAVCFSRQEQGDLIDWIARRFKALDCDIDSEDAKYLIFLCGDLMTGLTGEISKIASYAKARRVTRADIDAVAAPVLDAIVFQMTDAIGAGDFDRAAAVLGDLYHMQEAPIKLLSMLGRQLRQLYSARLALERKKGPAWLAALWGMRSSYPAERLLGSARRFSLSWCRMAVCRCAETDLAMKSTGMNNQDLLTGFLLELAAASGKSA